jgi:hypothetical protein
VGPFGGYSGAVVDNWEAWGPRGSRVSVALAQSNAILSERNTLLIIVPNSLQRLKMASYEFMNKTVLTPR